MSNVAKRVGGLCGRLVTVNPECRANVTAATRADDGLYYDAERESFPYSGFVNVVRSVGRVAAVTPDKSRVKVVFDKVRNGLWFNASDLLVGEIECHCGDRYAAKAFGEPTAYCAVCEACD